VFSLSVSVSVSLSLSLSLFLWVRVSVYCVPSVYRAMARVKINYNKQNKVSFMVHHYLNLSMKQDLCGGGIHQGLGFNACGFTFMV
jgi:hypothetical protein